MKKYQQIYDCVIIGGGPGGLTAGIYLSRFLCKTLIIDNNSSRASLIPISHNYPGFPNGISGPELLQLLREQCQRYGAEIYLDLALTITQENKQLFSIQTQHSRIQARYVILATGVLDIEPPLPNLKETIKNGLIRHCLICDAYEVRNQKIAILGEGRKGLNEAFLLSRYSKNITLFCLGKKPSLTAHEKNRIKASGIILVNDPIDEVVVIDNKINTFVSKGSQFEFDTVYSALGTYIRSELGLKLKVKCLKNKRIVVNNHQETSIKGVYAIGDVVTGLNQISVAIGQAAVAASHIFNRMSKEA